MRRICEEILPAVLSEVYWSGDTVFRRKDGSRVLVDHALAYSEEGPMLCLLRDFVDEESQERTLKEERQRFDQSIRAVEEYVILVLDARAYIVTWNEGAERIRGYSEGELLGDHVSVIYSRGRREAG